MSNTEYQGIEYINLSSNSAYLNKNNQIDTSGKVDEKINNQIINNTYNYYVDALNTDTVNTNINKTIYFKYDQGQNKFTIQEKINDNYISFNPSISSSLLNKADNSIYVLKSTDNEFNQIWSKNTFFDPAQPITLSGELTVNNIANFNNNINCDTITLKNNNTTPSNKTIQYITKDINSSSADDNKTITTKAYVDNNTVGKKEYISDVLKGEIFNSYSEQNKNIASGFYSHAEGNNTTASGDNSHSSGYNTVAYNDNMTAIGQYNISGNKSDNDEKLFVVGNGSDENNRSDAFVVKNNGDITMKNLEIQENNLLFYDDNSTISINIDPKINKLYTFKDEILFSRVYNDDIYTIRIYDDTHYICEKYHYNNGTFDKSEVCKLDYNKDNNYIIKIEFYYDALFILRSTPNDTHQQIITRLRLSDYGPLEFPLFSGLTYEYILNIFLSYTGGLHVLFKLNSDTSTILTYFIYYWNDYVFEIKNITINKTILYTGNYCYTPDNYIFYVFDNIIYDQSSQLYMFNIYYNSNWSSSSSVKYTYTIKSKFLSENDVLNNAVIKTLKNSNDNTFNYLICFIKNTTTEYIYLLCVDITNTLPPNDYTITDDDTTYKIYCYNLYIKSPIDNYYDFRIDNIDEYTLEFYVKGYNLYYVIIKVLSTNNSNLKINIKNKYNINNYIYTFKNNSLDYFITNQYIYNTNTIYNTDTLNLKINANKISMNELDVSNINVSSISSSSDIFNIKKKISFDYVGLQPYDINFIMHTENNTPVYNGVYNNTYYVYGKNDIRFMTDESWNNASSGIEMKYNGGVNIKGNVSVAGTLNSTNSIQTNTLTCNKICKLNANYLAIISGSDWDGSNSGIALWDTNINIKASDHVNFLTPIIKFNSSNLHVKSYTSNLLKSNVSDPILISACDDSSNIYSLKMYNNKYIISKYLTCDNETIIYEFNKDNIINQIYYFNNYLLLTSNKGIEYINLIDKELSISILLIDDNINKIVINPTGDQFYVLYNSYNYFSKYSIINNEFIKLNYQVFTQENGYDQSDLNVINMMFYNDYIYFIHQLYKDNNNYYIVYSNYSENEITRNQSNVSFNNEYYYIDSYCYENYIYFLLTQNGSLTELIKINRNNINDYEIYDNIIDDNITNYNQNIYYNYNDNNFYLVSNNYIYCFIIDNNLIHLENKLYVKECKYINSRQTIFMSNLEIININGKALLNGNILLNGTIKSSLINASQINISDIDVNVNKTITHNTLIYDNIENYQVGQPVFIKDNKTYTLQRKSNDGKYPVYDYIEINNNNYLKNPINQIPMITYEQNNGEDNYTFIGVITAIYPANTPLKINEITSNYIKINNNTVDFATHGDYIFKVDNNKIEHQTTSGNSKKYKVGDEILYDGKIIDPEQPLTRKLENMIVGKITCIPENNTEYVSVFKN